MIVPAHIGRVSASSSSSVLITHTRRSRLLPLLQCLPARVAHHILDIVVAKNTCNRIPTGTC